jgi:predicted nucleic acid-binding protein
MAQILTFVDSGILIAAARSQDARLRIKALTLLSDPKRDSASSDFVKLEVLPKAIWARNQAERQFYESFFNAVSHWPADNNAVIRQAVVEACKVGLNGMDALHIAAAVLISADELATIEKPAKSIHRTQSVKIISIR